MLFISSSHSSLVFAAPWECLHQIHLERSTQGAQGTENPLSFHVPSFALCPGVIVNLKKGCFLIPWPLLHATIQKSTFSQCSQRFSTDWQHPNGRISQLYQVSAFFMVSGNRPVFKRHLRAKPVFALSKVTFLMTISPQALHSRRGCLTADMWMAQQGN